MPQIQADFHDMMSEALAMGKFAPPDMARQVSFGDKIESAGVRQQQKTRTEDSPVCS